MILYRYISIDNHFDRIITACEVYFNNPSNFNDPFDCNYVLDTSATAAEKTTYITQSMSGQGGFTQAQIDAAVNKALNNHSSFDSLVNDSKNRFLSRIGVLCFSKTNENPLLWAHYSTKHKGVCLVYDTSKDKTFFAKTYEIKYRANYPRINFINDRGRFDELVLTKSNDWVYEQEVRAMKDNFGLQNFNPACLVGMIFGCKTPMSEITRIKTLLTANGFNISTKKAILRQASYGLDFEDI